jgi:hypothetical protein
VSGLLRHLIDAAEQDVAVAFAVAVTVYPDVGATSASFPLDTSKSNWWADHSYARFRGTDDVFDDIGCASSDNLNRQ